MTEFQKQIDSDEDKTPRGAAKFLATSAAMALAALKNPGRRRGAAEEIRKALAQIEAELTRVYAIERTARAFVADYSAHPRVDTGTPEEVEAFRGLNEALAVQVPE